MGFYRLINLASLLFLGLAFLLYYRYPPAIISGDDYPKSIYEFNVKDLHGNDVPLRNYRGKVLLIVNVASKCGLTQSNYRELNILYDKYKHQGFEILAFPCNQFAWQEPGTNEEIQLYAPGLKLNSQYLKRCQRPKCSTPLQVLEIRKRRIINRCCKVEFYEVSGEQRRKSSPEIRPGNTTS